MRVPLLVLLSLVPLAGCFSSDDGADPDLVDSDGDGIPDVDEVAAPGFGFLQPVDLLCPSDGVQYAVLDQVGGCGDFGEPVIEVAGDGAIWASATCCVGRSPPIWVSRDGGESFALLPFADRTGAIRDAFGIEGDFAIDDAGNVYFFDISAASSWFSKYQADGTHVFTKADVFPPLVDRPWVRAGVADEVWVFYNTAMSTNLFHSTDGGLTWTVLPVGFECGLMTIGQGPVRDRLFVAGCGGSPQLFISEDGGTTFGPSIALPVPPGEFTNSATDPFIPPVSDAAGNIYVFFEHATDPDVSGVGLYMDVVMADGTVKGPFLVTNETTVNHKPWPAAGEEGQVAVAWYATNQTFEDGQFTGDPTWFLYSARVHDALSDAPTFEVVRADPDPVLVGADLGRSLGDFLESDVGPDGRYHIIYARRDETGLVNRVVISDDATDLGKGVPYNGPLVAA